MVLQRIGIIGDVHAQHKTLESALAFLETQNIDRVLCTGDLADGDTVQTGDLNRVCELLQNVDALVVKGNHDRWLLQEKYRDWSDATPLDSVTPATREYLDKLPRSIPLETSVGKFWLFHGLAENDFRWLKPEEFENASEDDADLQAILRGEYSFVLAGHTHIRQVQRAGNFVCLNAGTLRPEYSPCLSVLDFNAMEIQFHDFSGGDWTPAERISLAP